MLKLKSSFKLAALAVFVLAFSMMQFAPVGAASDNADGKTADASQNITQAYSTEQQLQRGMIVGLSSKSPNAVFALDSDHAKQMQGVVVAANDAPVTLSDNGAGSQVYVATLGRYPVLVSNQNGAIEPGDYITVSSLAGIGMKADSSSQLVVGKAASGFSGSKNVLSNETLGATSSGQQKVAIGLVNTDLGIAHNPLQAQGHQIAGIGWLQSAASSVAGSDVSPARVYAAAALFIVAAIIVIIILYSGIRGDMLAIGRNPLARAAIGRNLFEVVLSAIVIFIIGLGAIYLVLKL